MRKQLEPFTGYLISAGDSGLLEEEFTYRITQNKSFTTTMAGGVPIDYVGVTLGIYTSNKDLSFAKGKPIRLADNRTMTIENMQEDINQFKATFDGIGLDGYFITLNGGK